MTKMYLVSKWSPLEGQEYTADDLEHQGIFSSPEKAAAACVSPLHFYEAFILDQRLPERTLPAGYLEDRVANEKPSRGR